MEGVIPMPKSDNAPVYFLFGMFFMGATIAVLVCVAQCYMDPHKKGQYR